MNLHDEVMRVVEEMRGHAEFTRDCDDFVTPSTVEDWAASIEKAISESARELPPEVGRAGPTQTSGGFTMAAFEVLKVPVGTKLYTIPPGYTLVPIEPTEEMINTPRNGHEGAPYLPASLWRSMLAASPKYNDHKGEHANKQTLPDSYTSYNNKVGLASDGEFTADTNKVVLVWPYKDCILEGGQEYALHPTFRDS